MEVTEVPNDAEGFMEAFGVTRDEVFAERRTGSTTSAETPVEGESPKPAPRPVHDYEALDRLLNRPETDFRFVGERPTLDVPIQHPFEAGGKRYEGHLTAHRLDGETMLALADVLKETGAWEAVWAAVYRVPVRAIYRMDCDDKEACVLAAVPFLPRSIRAAMEMEQ